MNRTTLIINGENKITFVESVSQSGKTRIEYVPGYVVPCDLREAGKETEIKTAIATARAEHTTITLVYGEERDLDAEAKKYDDHCDAMREAMSY